MKTQRTTNHLAKGAAALLALVISFGSFAAAASALQPGPFEPPTAPGVDELGVPGICELVECVPPDDDDGDEDPGDDGEDDPGDEGEDEPDDEEEPEVEVEDETEENIDTPVEATPTFTG